MVAHWVGISSRNWNDPANWSIEGIESHSEWEGRVVPGVFTNESHVVWVKNGNRLQIEGEDGRYLKFFSYAGEMDRVFVEGDAHLHVDAEVTCDVAEGATPALPVGRCGSQTGPPSPSTWPPSATGSSGRCRKTGRRTE